MFTSEHAVVVYNTIKNSTIDKIIESAVTITFDDLYALSDNYHIEYDGSPGYIIEHSSGGNGTVYEFVCSNSQVSYLITAILNVSGNEIEVKIDNRIGMLYLYEKKEIDVTQALRGNNY